MEVALGNCCDSQDKSRDKMNSTIASENPKTAVLVDGSAVKDSNDALARKRVTEEEELEGVVVKKEKEEEEKTVNSAQNNGSSVDVTPNGDVRNNGENCVAENNSNSASPPDVENVSDDSTDTKQNSGNSDGGHKAAGADDDDDGETDGNAEKRNENSAVKEEEEKECDTKFESKEDCMLVDTSAESNMETSEVEIKDSEVEIKDSDSESNVGGGVDSTGEDGKEQTIIITETKSLAKAINDAVKTPDGKPTLVIIETKTSVVTATTTTVTTSGSAMVLSSAAPKAAAVTVSEAKRPSNQLSTLQSQLVSSITSSSVGLPPIPRQSILQGTLMAPPRVVVKPDPGPSVPLPEDAEVSVDVPSLIVPYLFECQARETLTHFLKKLGPLEVESSDEGAPAKVAMTSTDEAIEAVVRGKSYFESALGRFFMDIGLAHVQEWVQTEILKAQRRKLARGWKTKERVRMVHDLQKTIGDAKQITSQYHFLLKKCTRCPFQSESKTVLEKHMETIHVVGNKMPCCFCDFETTAPAAIYNHLYAKHRAFGRLDKFNNFHMCPLCPFEDANKSRVTRHSWKCQKAFVPEKNLAPAPDYEPPAKRTRLVASVAALKSMSAVAAGGVRGSVSASASQPHGSHHQQVLGSRGPPPIRPKPGELRITPSYVQSVLRSTYLSTPQPVRGVSQVVTSHPSFIRSTNPIGSRLASPSTIILPRHQVPVTSQPYSIQPSQLYQVVHQGAGGVVPVVRGTVGNFHSPPRFTILPTPPATVTTRGPTPVALIPNLASTASGSSVGSTSSFSAQLRTSAPMKMSPGTSVSLASPLLAASQQARASAAAKPNISITPVSKAVSTARVSVQSTALGVRTSQPAGGSAASNPSYVVCEICDGYIKDLDQLRNHMQWIHKVKIHPKMIHNRPPLNCQKCHYRFFTDQGLERHLLGSHGLVTSSMQENANKGKDGGRCIICGKVFLWKLVVHMAKDHKMTLKPAHLSYKCTVCSATFNMYRLFETHVYEEHSTVAKRVLDAPKNSGPSATSGTSSTVLFPVGKSAPNTASSKVLDESPPRSCVECGIKFKCPSNCIRHMKETHVKPCQVKLCRVDKCVRCTAKNEASEQQQQPEVEEVVDEEVTDKVLESAKTRPDVRKQRNVDKDDVVEVLDPEPKRATRVSAKREVREKQQPPPSSEDQADDVFDMEVETVEDHSSPGSVHTDVESD